MSEVTIPAYAADTLHETLTLQAPDEWHDRIRALAPRCAYGPQFHRSVVYCLRAMSSAAKAGYWSVAHDYLVAAERQPPPLDGDALASFSYRARGMGLTVKEPHMAATEPLTVADLVALSTLLNAATAERRIRWLDQNGVLQEGVARCFAHQGGGFAGLHDDVRDMYLHVSGTFEQWLPVRDLIPMIHKGAFVVDSEEAQI